MEKKTRIDLFVVFVVVVAIITIIIGVSFKNTGPKPGENVRVATDPDPLGVYRGIVTNKTIEISGQWAKIEVVTPSDNTDISWRLDVLYFHEDPTITYVNMKNLKVGDELLFRKFNVQAMNYYATTSHFSEVGYLVGWGRYVDQKQLTILNPPKK